MKGLLLEAAVQSLNTINVLNDNQKLHINRQIEVFCLATGTIKTYIGDSLLKVLALSYLQPETLPITEKTKEVINMDDRALLEKFDFEFSNLSISLGKYTVWKYQ